MRLSDFEQAIRVLEEPGGVTNNQEDGGNRSETREMNSIGVDGGWQSGFACSK